MYTVTHSHLGAPNIFFREVSEAAITHNAIDEASKISPEAKKLSETFAQMVVDAFETNPESKNAFLSSLDGIKQEVFKSPEMFRAFLNRAYEKQEMALKGLKGGERLKKIQDFSTFVRDAMLQFADMNNFERFSQAIKAQSAALERKELDMHLEIEDQLRKLRERVTPGAPKDWKESA